MSEPTLRQIENLPIVVEQWAGSGGTVVLLHTGVGDRCSWYGTADPPAISGAPDPADLDPHTQRLIGLMQAAGAADDIQELNRLETWLWLDEPASPEGRVGEAARDLALAMNEIILHNDVPEAADTSGVDAWQHLEAIEVPVTVAWGELDVPFVIDQCKQLVERLANAQGHVLAGVVHMPYLENSRMVAELITSAIS